MGVHTEAIQKLYAAYVDRPADAQGLVNWDKVITDANRSTTAPAL